MGRISEADITPRNGHTLMVGIGCRISGCAKQKEQSLADQEEHGKEVVAEYYSGPAQFVVIATKGKGERLDRPELAQIEKILRRGELDLFVFEDLGRLVRGHEAVRLLGVGVDYGTRTIIPNDCIDTADPTWEEDALNACAAHVAHNAHTSKRLKKKLMNRFCKLGGSVPCPIYGYVKPLEAKTFHDLQRDTAATPIYRQWFEKLRVNRNYSAVADWLNAQGVPTGPYSRKKQWNGKMVRRITHNPILKGCPGRGFRHTIKVHGTGRRVSVKNPDGPKFADSPYPHLVHVDAELFDEVNALLDASNKDFSRKPVNGRDPRWRLPHSRTRSPGRHARCWYCGRQYVWGGNGMTENLMCGGSREWRCWNSIGFNGSLAVRKLREAITAELYRLDGFDEQFRRMVEAAASDAEGGLADRGQELRRKELAVEREQANVVAAIAECGPVPLLKKKLAELQEAATVLRRHRAELERVASRRLEVPGSATDLRRRLEEQFDRLAAESDEFGLLLRALVPDFHVYLVRLCDGGHLLPRARVRLALDGTIPDAAHVPGLSGLLERTLTIDLFHPPQRERIREAAVRLAGTGLEQRLIATHEDLPERVTQTAVSRALQLDREVRASGVASPYEPLYEPPVDYSKLRRHRSTKYKFSPLEGYVPPSL